MTEAEDISTILKLGAEGGSITLRGRRTAAGAWEFRRDVLDSSLAMLDEEEAGGVTRSQSAWVSSWAEAVGLLDRYPWARLIPLEVHPEFRDEVLLEATRRLLQADRQRAGRSLERWMDLCRST